MDTLIEDQAQNPASKKYNLSIEIPRNNQPFNYIVQQDILIDEGQWIRLNLTFQKNPGSPLTSIISPLTESLSVSKEYENGIPITFQLPTKSQYYLSLKRPMPCLSLDYSNKKYTIPVEIYAKTSLSGGSFRINSF